MHAIKHAVILAAGRGARMMPLTEVLPKPMAPFENSTLIAKGIEKLRPHIEHLHVTVGYKGAMLAQHLIEHGVSSVFNTDEQSNSWWIHNTLLARLDEPVFVLTCDNVTDIDFDALARDYFAQGAPLGMLVSVKPVPGLDGDYIFRAGDLVTQLSRTERAETYCSGIQVLNPGRIAATLDAGGDFYAIWRQLIERRALHVSAVQPSRWFTIDTLDDLRRTASHG